MRGNFKDGQILGTKSFFHDFHESNEIIDSPKASFLTIIQAACEVFNIEQEMLISINKSRKALIICGAVITLAYENEIQLEKMATYFNKSARP